MQGYRRRVRFRNFKDTLRCGAGQGIHLVTDAVHPRLHYTRKC